MTHELTARSHARPGGLGAGHGVGIHMTDEHRHLAAGAAFPFSRSLKKSRLIQIYDHPLRVGVLIRFGDFTQDFHRQRYCPSGGGDPCNKQQITA